MIASRGDTSQRNVAHRIDIVFVHPPPPIESLLKSAWTSLRQGRSPRCPSAPSADLSISFHSKISGCGCGLESVSTVCHPMCYVDFRRSATLAGRNAFAGRLRVKHRQCRGSGRGIRRARNAWRPSEWRCRLHVEGRVSSLEQLIANSFRRGKRNVPVDCGPPAGADNL